MSKKRVTYTADFKAKVIIELLEGDMTVNEIASKYDLLPKNVHNWKQQFLSNACLAFDKSSVVKEYKQEIDELRKDKDATSKKLVEVIVERDFLMGKLKSLVSSNDRVNSVDTKLELSLNNQLKLLSVSKSVYYYTPISKFSSNDDIKLLNAIDLIHTKHPYYGTRRLVKLLNRLGFLVGRKLIKSAMEFMGIKALYPKKKTTVINKQHKKYPYLLNVFKNETN
ncbi:IS3 family transposase [Francisella halioticida]|nr:IS3 family transposase [Francisella halioticida]